MAASTPHRTRRRRPARKPRPNTPRSTPEAIQEFRTKSPRLRLISVWLVLIVGMLGLVGRLAYLQLMIGSDLKLMAEEQQAIQATPRTSRRQMVDRQGNVVAMDRVVYTLYVHPMLFSKPSDEIANAVSGVLG
ncbi:MAG: penicillin-binding protein 2, partial [Cyanobacteria bacterium J06632_3]